MGHQPGNQAHVVLVGHVHDGEGVFVVVEADFFALVPCVCLPTNVARRHINIRAQPHEDMMLPPTQLDLHALPPSLVLVRVAKKPKTGTTDLVRCR